MTNSSDPIAAGPVVPVEPHPAPARHPWGFWMTSVWIVLAVALAIACGTLLTLSLYPDLHEGHLEEWSRPAFVFFATFYGTIILVLVIATHSARWSIGAYFAFGLPKRSDVVAGLAVVLAWSAFSFGLLWLFGFGKADIDLLVNAHRSAVTLGTVPLLWILAIVAAPVLEELVFRGFIYRGWSQARLLGTTRTIVLTSLLFGLMHFHYTWFGILDTVVFGLIAGWARWQSGTLVLPILLHAANNIIVMLYVVSQASAPLAVTGL